MNLTDLCKTLSRLCYKSFSLHNWISTKEVAKEFSEIVVKIDENSSFVDAISSWFIVCKMKIDMIMIFLSSQTTTSIWKRVQKWNNKRVKINQIKLQRIS